MDATALAQRLVGNHATVVGDSAVLTGRPGAAGIFEGKLKGIPAGVVMSANVAALPGGEVVDESQDGLTSLSFRVSVPEKRQLALQVSLCSMTPSRDTFRLFVDGVEAAKGSGEQARMEQGMLRASSRFDLNLDTDKPHELRMEVSGGGGLLAFLAMDHEDQRPDVLPVTIAPIRVEQPPRNVPEAGSTFLLLVAGLVSLAAVRKRI